MPTINLEVPVAGTTIGAGLHVANYADLQALLNGGLDATNMAPGYKVTRSPFAGGPPSSPTTGDIWIATSVGNNPISWSFIYQGASPHAHKWEFLGGPALALNDGAAATSSSVSLVEITNPGIQLARAGTYHVEGSSVQHLSGWNLSQIFYCYTTIGVSGSQTNETISQVSLPISGSQNVLWHTASARSDITVAASETVRFRFRSNSTDATVSVSNRMLAVSPVRVS